MSAVFLLLASMKVRAQHDEAMFVQLELDYFMQTQLLRSIEIIDEFERQGILERLGQHLVRVPADPDPEECAVRYLAESVAKGWIDSALVISKGDLWVGRECREAFLTASLYNEVELQHGGFLREISLEFKELARMHGVSVATVWFLTEFTQIAAITVLTAYGLGQYAILAPFIPLSFINTGIAIQLKSVRHHKGLRRGYGSRTVKREAMFHERNVRDRLGLYYRGTLLTAFGEEVHDTTLLVAVQDPVWISKILRGGRRNPERMYFGKARAYVRRNAADASAYERIFSDKTKSKRMRTMLTVQYMFSADTELFSSFKKRYPEVFIEVPTDVYLTAAADAGVKSWVYYMLQRDAPEELRDGLARIPELLSVRETLDLLENLIYPYWARNMQKSDFRAFRRMVKGTRDFRYATLTEQNKLWNLRFTQRLLTGCHMAEFYDL